MSIFLSILLAVQMISAVAMIGLILVQHGKGADMGAAFGSGGSGSLSVPAVVPTFFRVPLLCCRPCSLSVPWRWPISDPCVRQQVLAVCWKMRPSRRLRRQPLHLLQPLLVQHKFRPNNQRLIAAPGSGMGQISG